MTMSQPKRTDRPEEEGEERMQIDPTVPNTRAPESGSPPAAGKISPAEKFEPSGVPVQAQQHNADPNAPQSQVVEPGETQTPESLTGGVPASSLERKPDIGSERSRAGAQVPNIPPPDAGE
jgi:hypothetical protein